MKIELSNVMATLDLFNRNVKRTVEAEYDRIQEVIKELVDDVCKESAQTVYKVVKEETKNIG